MESAPRSHRRAVVLAAVCVVVVAGVEPPAFAAQGSKIEEIAITGSHFPRRDAFDQAAPVAILDAVDIAEHGTPSMGEIVKNQTYNYGTDYLANATASTFQDGSRSFANFRGLGESATLTLVNGLRAGTGNVNLLYPQLAIERIESLKDGAAALYGADAMAGVINFVPRTDFEGMEVQLYHLLPEDGAGEYDETQWSVMLGAASETTHVVGAFEYRERGRLRVIDRPDYNHAQYSISSTGQPGTWAVPRRMLDAEGNVVLAPALTLADPGCGIGAAGGTDKNRPGNYASGMRDVGGARCAFEYGEFFDYHAELEGFTAWAHAAHELNDSLSFEGELSFARHEASGRGSPSNPGGRFGEIGAIAGEHPGNPFRSFVDANGNGRVDADERLLYAADVDADGMADRDAAGQVVLAVNPFAPRVADPHNPGVAPDANGGVPFNEDVVPVAFRLFGKQGTRPSALNGDGSGEGAISSIDTSFRVAGGVRFEIPDSTWSGSIRYAHQRHLPQFPEQGESFSATLDGLAGRLGPDDDQFFNPFSTAAHPCVNRDCDSSTLTPASSPAFNSQFVADEISYRDDIDVEDVYHFGDILLTGEATKLWAGPLVVAVGAGWRRVDVHTDVGPIANACDRWVNACGFDFDESRTTHALFTEIALPLVVHEAFGSLDLQAALRYEDAGGGHDSTDPKLALRWQPRDWLAVRGTWGTSFAAPDLRQLHAAPISFLEHMLDSGCGVIDETYPAHASACHVAGAFRTQTFSGNEDLEAERADVWSAGLSLSLAEDDLRVSIDVVEIDFEDRISRLRGQDVIDADVERFRQFLADNDCSVGDPECGLALRATWIDPVNKATGRFEDTDIVRTVPGEIVEVHTRWVNARTMLWRGIDFAVDYRWDAVEMPYVGGDYGTFNVHMGATYVDTYEYSLTGAPFETCQGEPGRRPPCEGAGHRNDRTGVVPPTPRWRANAQLAWFWGNHSALLVARYTHHVKDDSVFVTPETVAAELVDPIMDSLTTIDAQYTLGLDDLLGDGRTTSITLGCLNCFDRLADPTLTLGGLETFLYDPRGRMWYARFTQTL